MDSVISQSTASELLVDILARWSPVGRSGLLPAMIEAQEKLGWLSEATLTQIANGLGVPLAHVYGVADFYAHLYTHPVGKKIMRVCDDVPCYLAGSERARHAIEIKLGIGENETTPDGEFTLEIVPCLGHCDHAPVIMIGNQVIEDVNEAQIEKMTKRAK